MYGLLWYSSIQNGAIFDALKNLSCLLQYGCAKDMSNTCTLLLIKAVFPNPFLLSSVPLSCIWMIFSSLL